MHKRGQESDTVALSRVAIHRMHVGGHTGTPSPQCARSGDTAVDIDVDIDIPRITDSVPKG